MATTITSNEGYTSSVSPDPIPEFKPSSFAENDSFEMDLLRPSIEAEKKYQEEGLKIRRTNYETIKKHTLDFDNFEPEQTSEVRHRVLASGYLDSMFREEDRPSNDHDILRDSVAKSRFGGEGVGSDEAFVAAIRKDFEGENERQKFYDNADRQATLSAFLGGGRVKTEFQQSMVGNPLAKSERLEINERWQKTQEKIEDKYGASLLFDIRTTFSDMQSDPDKWLMHASHRTRNYTDEEKNLFMFALRDLATAYPSEVSSTFGGNFAKGTSRGVGGALDKGSEAAMEFFRNAGVGVHNVFVAPFAENLGTESSKAWSEEKRQNDKDWLKRERDAVDFQAELRDVFEQDYAPTQPLAPKDTSLRAIEEGVYAIPGAITTSAVAFIPVVGMPLSFGMMKEFDREKYRREILADGGSRDDAYRLSGGMSMVSAVPNMLLEKFQSYGLAGKVPGLGKVFNKIDDIFANKVGRFGTKMLVAGAAETAVELTQHANTDLVQDITSSFKSAVPGIEWKNGKDGHFDGYFNKTLTTFVAVAPLGVMVAGRGLTQERRAEAMKQASPLERKAFGITEEASAKLDAAQTPREMVQAFQDAVKTRAPWTETAQESVMELEEMHKMRTQTNEDAETFGVSPSVRVAPDKSTFEVFDRLTGDTLAEVNTAQEATEEVFNQLQMKEQESRQYFQQLLASFEAASLDVEQSGEAVEVGTGTFTDADAEAAMPGSDRRLQTERELLEQRDGGTGAVAQEVMSEGRSGHIAGVYVPAGQMGRKEAVTQLHNSASVLTLIHERGHAKRRKLMESGAWTREDQISSLRGLDNLITKSDERFMPENFEELSGYDQEVAIDEAIAELSEVLALNSRKGKNSKMGGLIQRNLSAMVQARIPGAAQLKSFIGSMRDFFGLQLKRATILRKAVRDGNLDQAQVDKLTDMLVGTNSQEVFEQERDAIPTQMVDGQQVDTPLSPAPLSIAEEAQAKATEEIQEELGLGPEVDAWFDDALGAADKGWVWYTTSRIDTVLRRGEIEQAETLLRRLEVALTKMEPLSKGASETLEEARLEEARQDIKDAKVDTSSPSFSITPADTSYRIQHQPSSDDATLNDLTEMFGEDIYGPNAAQYYGAGMAGESEVLDIFKKVRGNPEAKVKIYRVVPAFADQINPGDWVTISKAAADEMNHSGFLGGDSSGNPQESKIISKVVTAKEVTWPGDSMQEQGYFPSSPSFSITPNGSYEKGGSWYHSTDANLDGKRLERWADGGSDMGGIFLSDDSLEGKRYSLNYGRNTYKTQINLESDEVFNLGNHEHRERVEGVELFDAVGTDFIRTALNSERDGTLDWSVVEPELLEAAGFKAAILFERPAGEFGAQPVRSIAVFDADSIGDLERVSDKSRDEISFSPGDARMLSDLSENVMRRVRAPEARAVVFEQLVDRIDALKRDIAKLIFGGTVVQEALPDARSMKSLKKEAAFRQADLREQYEKDGVEQPAKKARTEANEWLEEQVAQQKKYYNPVARIRRSLVMYDALLKTLPPELRGKMGGFVQIGKLNSDKARLEFLEQKVEQLDIEVDKWISGKHRKQIEEIFKANRPKKKSSGQPKVDSDATYADQVMKIEKLSKLTRDEVEAKILKVDGKLETETDETKIQKLTEKRDSLSVFGNIDGMKANALGDFYQNLNTIHRQGKLLKAMTDEQFNQFLQETIGMVNDDVTGGRGDLTQSEIKMMSESRRKKKINLKYIGAENIELEGMSDFHRKNLPFEWLLNNLARGNKDAETMKSKTHERLATMVHLSTTREDRANMDTQEKYREVLGEIFGVKVGGQLSTGTGIEDLMEELERVEETNISKMEYGKEGRSTAKRIPASKVQAILNGEATIEGLGISEADWAAIQVRYAEIQESGKNIKDNTRVEYESQTEGEAKMMSLSRSQALNLTMLWRQEGLRGSMEHEGYSEQTMKDMEEFLTPEDKRLRDWLTIQYEDNYHKINKVFRAQNGFSLPKTDFYSPAIRIALKEAKDMSIDSEGRQAMSVDPNFTITRTANKAPMDQKAGALSIYISHTLQTNHYTSWADTVKTLRSVFSDGVLRDNIKGYVGTDALRTIEERIQWFADGGNRKATHIAWMDKLRAAHTYNSLAFKWAIAVKQLTSIPAYAYDMGFVNFAKYGARWMKNPVKNMMEMWNTDYVQNRFKKGYERDVIDGLRTKAGANKFKKALQVGMLSGKLGDIVPVMMGGWIAREHAYDQAKRDGMTDADAKRKAEVVSEMVSDRSQQAGGLKDLSTFQGDGSVFKLFTMYKTSPRQYYANVYESGLDMLAGKKGSKTQFARRFAISHMLLPLTFQFVSDITRMGLRPDDEDAFSGENYLRAMLLGPLNGLFIAGDALDIAISAISGAKVWAKEIPILGGVMEAARGGDLEDAADNIIRGIGKLTPGAFTFYDIITDEYRRLMN